MRRSKFRGRKLSKYASKRPERKFTEFDSNSITYPSASVVKTAPDSATKGGIDDKATANPEDLFSYFLVAYNSSESDPYPNHIQFGSRARIVYNATLGVPPAGAYGNFNDVVKPLDGSFPLVLHPASYAGSNNVLFNQYTGRKYVTTGVGIKVNFFNTSIGDWASNGLWSGETLITVYLILQKDCSRSFQCGTPAASAGFYDHINLSLLKRGNAANPLTSTGMDTALNDFNDPDIMKNIKILRKWKLELASSGGSEAFLPFEEYVKFPKGIITEVDKDSTTNIKGDGQKIIRNRLSLLFCARGAACMTYSIRQYFHDI